MTVIAIADIKAAGPEFSATPDATIQYFADIATTMTNFDWLGARAVWAGANLAAHMMKMAGYGITTSPIALPGVSSITVGEDTISFTQPKNANHLNLEATQYGARYLMLINMVTVQVL
jgi:hypothetical protein